MKNILETIFRSASSQETVNWSLLKGDSPRNRRNPAAGNPVDKLNYSSMSGDLHDRMKRKFHDRMKSMNLPADHSELFQ